MFAPSVLLSSLQASAEQKLISAYQSFLEEQYCSVAARVLFLWDFVITLEQEVHYVWGQRFSGATCLFLLNRYVNLLVTILELFERASFQTPRSCDPFVRVLQSLLIVALLVVTAFTTLRVYAIWSHDWRPALPVLLLALIPPITSIYVEATTVPIIAPHPSVGCALELHGISLSLYSKFTVINRAVTTAYDGLVVIFTLARTVGLRRAAKVINTKTSLVSLLLRDGAIYFFLLLLLNIAQIIVASLVVGDNAVSYFVSPVTSILISRFLLNLRQVGRTPVGADAGAGASTRTPVFTSRLSAVHFVSVSALDVVGNLGAPLRRPVHIGEAQWDEWDVCAEPPAPAREPFMAGIAPAPAGDVELAEVA